MIFVYSFKRKMLKLLTFLLQKKLIIITHWICIQNQKTYYHKLNLTMPLNYWHVYSFSLKNIYFSVKYLILFNMCCATRALIYKTFINNLKSLMRYAYMISLMSPWLSKKRNIIIDTLFGSSDIMYIHLFIHPLISWWALSFTYDFCFCFWNEREFYSTTKGNNL